MSVPTHQFIDEKPNFRVVSFDGKFWMHTYTASPIPLNNRHWREVAFEALSSESIGGSDETLWFFNCSEVAGRCGFEMKFAIIQRRVFAINQVTGSIPSLAYWLTKSNDPPPGWSH